MINVNAFKERGFKLIPGDIVTDGEGCEIVLTDNTVAIWNDVTSANEWFVKSLVPYELEKSENE